MIRNIRFIALGLDCLTDVVSEALPTYEVPDGNAITLRW